MLVGRGWGRRSGCFGYVGLIGGEEKVWGVDDRNVGIAFECS